MWKMFDNIVECNECGSLLGPPPKFMIPPPPLPPSINTYVASATCSNKEVALQAQKAWDSDTSMCEAIPILDASLHSSQSLQTSAMIAVFSLLLILVVLISSLFVWKNKRKVQNFFPCKTPTRGPHIAATLSALAPGHSTAAFDDPDPHLAHHRPLVMRHHHTVEVMHNKSVHYPSGYPMTRSPPFLVSNSPGPDPYRSNDNVYEELGPARDSDGESEPAIQSDDDFAEDELSLPGERTFSKTAEPNPSNTVTIAYQNVSAASTSNCAERLSILSSASSTQDTSSATTASASSTSSHNNNSNLNTTNISTSTRTTTASILAGMLRHNAGRKPASNGNREKLDRRSHHPEDTNRSATTSGVGNLRSIQKLYDNSSNLIALGCQRPTQQHDALNYAQPQIYHHSLHHLHYNNGRTANAHSVPHFYNTIESEVERRNRVNFQLKNSSNAPVATIYRERVQYPRSHRYTQYSCARNPSKSSLVASAVERINPRSNERRRGEHGGTVVDQAEPAYGYTEPVCHQNYHYHESCNATNSMHRMIPSPMPAYSSYIMPEYSSGSLSSFRKLHHPATQTYQNPTSLYVAGDSSFGSDSGYSHHTPASSIGRHEYDIAIPTPPAPATPAQKPSSKLASALSFSWNKKKSSNGSSMTTHLNKNKVPTLPARTAIEASSPNNNSGSSTITSTLENTSSSSSVALQSQNNNDLIQS